MSDQETKSKENQNFLNQKIEEILFTTVESRAKDYDEGKLLISHINNMPLLISNVANKNAVISGGISLIPGPWGMAAAIPEIALVIKNQLDLIYDIGKACGKTKKDLEPGLVLALFASAIGSKTIGLLSIHGGKVLVQRSSLRIVQKLVILAGGRVTQQVAKSVVAKWIPIAGAVGMAAWSRYLTKVIGEKALELFSLPFEYIETTSQDEAIIDENIQIISEIKTPKSNNYLSTEKAKISALINLMKIDSRIENSESEFIFKIISNSELTDDLKSKLIQSLGSKDLLEIDINDFDDDERIPLILDIISLAKIDDNLHTTELMYIKQIAKMLNFKEEEIGSFMEFTQPQMA